jgi:DNA-binding NarL/FixJ family response regulator
MGYLLIIIGTILVISAWKPTVAAFRTGHPPAIGEEEPWLARLEAGLEEVARRLAELENQVEALTQVTAARTAPSPAEAGILAESFLPDFSEARGSEVTETFSEVLAQAEAEAWRQEVLSAYAAGEEVTEIARRLGRGKGEVELVLSLYQRS